MHRHWKASGGSFWFWLVWVFFSPRIWVEPYWVRKVNLYTFQTKETRFEPLRKVLEIQSGQKPGRQSYSF